MSSDKASSTGELDKKKCEHVDVMTAVNCKGLTRINMAI